MDIAPKRRPKGGAADEADNAGNCKAFEWVQSVCLLQNMGLKAARHLLAIIN